MEDFDYKKARLFLTKKIHDQQKLCFQKFQQATNDFNKIMKLIISKYCPQKVYQWGSLLNKNAFKAYSDIDIAIEGIQSAELFFNLYKDAEALTDFPLDIVQMEKIEPEFRNIIQKKGKLVYERNQ